MDLHISLDGHRNVAARVYAQLRDAILDGRLRGGEALPSSRGLADRVGVSRNTVLLAYARLREEGLVESHRGAGTFVRTGLPSRTARQARDSPLRARSLWDDIPDAVDVAALECEFELTPGLPDSAHFPFPAWRARIAHEFHPAAMGSGAPSSAAGLARLRSELVRHVSVSRAVRATPDEVIVTNGSQQAIDLIARVLLEPGDVVAVEDPGYPLPRRALHAYGCRVIGVPVDDEGLRVDALPPNARLVLVTPSHQYPLGMPMPNARRRALVEWAERTGATIVEDDYDSEFRYDGRPLDSLQSLDDRGRVIYVGSFSKVLLPTLRLGFLIAPATLQSAFRKAKLLTDWHTPLALQGAMASFLADGLLAEHIRRMRAIYAERHELVRRIVERDFAGHLVALPSTGGLHIATYLSDAALRDRTDRVIVEQAHAAGVSVIALSPNYHTEPPRQGLLLGYGAIATKRIALALERLSTCL
jgi:GntR family transcriptional regulator/MocR family aminotransferase